MQITRNLEDFSIEGASEVVCYETNRYSAPASSSGVTYSWQLPAGWTGVQNANYIDVTATGSSGNITCTMMGCNQSKVSSPKSVSVNVVDPGKVISGNRTVCSVGSTFTVSDISPLNSFYWTLGPYLSIVSGQNTSSCRIKSTGNGSSWIKAKIISDCGNYDEIPTFYLWAGNPPYPEITSNSPFVWTTAYGEPATKEFTIYTEQDIVFYDENTDIYGGLIENFDWTWYLDGGGLWYDEYNYGVGGKMYIFHSPGVFRVRTSTENNCGATGMSAPVFVNVIQEEYLMNLSPNPATNETIISITNSSKKEDLNVAWDLEVYDSSQLLKEKQSGVKGKSAKLNTSNWKEGVYIVRANYNGNVLTNKLVVKR